jgi:hypothetical protein
VVVDLEDWTCVCEMETVVLRAAWHGAAAWNFLIFGVRPHGHPLGISRIWIGLLMGLGRNRTGRRMTRRLGEGIGRDTDRSYG